MNTGTAATRTAVARAWEPVLRHAGAQGQELGEQILALAHQIAKHRLSGPLTDPGRTPEHKADLATRLFSGRVDVRIVELLCACVRGRWSQPVNLLTALHDLGVQAILAGARAAGRIEVVEQEIFGVSQQLHNNTELRRALEPSRRTSTEDRVRLARRVFSPVISPAAMSLVVWCVRHRALGGVPYNLRRVTQLAAALQNRTIADVVTAVPMTVAQEERLRIILQRRLGTDIELNTQVDPAVIGGMRIRVRDLVIDSSVRAAVAQVRDSLVG